MSPPGSLEHTWAGDGREELTPLVPLLLPSRPSHVAISHSFLSLSHLHPPHPASSFFSSLSHKVHSLAGCFFLRQAQAGASVGTGVWETPAQQP